jgi:hypothetical protein
MDLIWFSVLHGSFVSCPVGQLIVGMSWSQALAAIDPAKTVTNEAFASMLRAVVPFNAVAAKRLRWFCLGQRPRHLHGAILDVAVKAHLSAALKAAAAATTSATRESAAERFEDLMDCVSEAHVSQTNLRATMPRVLEGMLVCDALLPEVRTTTRAWFPVLAESLGGASDAAQSDVGLARIAVLCGRWDVCLQLSRAAGLDLPKFAEGVGRHVGRGDARSAAERSVWADAWARSLAVAACWVETAATAEAGLLLTTGIIGPQSNIGRMQRRDAGAAIEAYLATKREPHVVAAAYAALRASSNWAAGLRALRNTGLTSLPDTALAAAVRLFGDSLHWQLADAVHLDLSSAGVLTARRATVNAIVFAYGHSARWREATAIASVAYEATPEGRGPLLATLMTALAHSEPECAGPVVLEVMARLRGEPKGVDAGSASYAVGILANSRRLDDAIAVLQNVKDIPQFKVTLLAANALTNAVHATVQDAASKHAAFRTLREAMGRRLRQQPLGEGLSTPLRVLSLLAANEVIQATAANNGVPPEATVSEAFAGLEAFIGSQEDFNAGLGHVLRELVRSGTVPLKQHVGTVSAQCVRALQAVCADAAGRTYGIDELPRIARSCGLPNEVIATHLMVL